MFISSLRYSIYKVQSLPSRFSPFIGQLVHSITAKPLCQELFSFLVKIFLCLVASSLPGALAYITKEYVDCQELFFIFYDFFSCTKPCVKIGRMTQNTVVRIASIQKDMCRLHNTPPTDTTAARYIPILPIWG